MTSSDIADRRSGSGPLRRHWWKKRIARLFGIKPPPPPDPFDTARRLLGGDGDGVLIDVGANRGQTAMRLRAIFPAARIIAFEPTEKHFAALAEVAASLDVVAVRKAVGDRNGEVRFNVDAQDYNHSILTMSANLTPFVSVRHEGDVATPIVTLDAFCAENGHERVALLKVDAEGADLHVLRGAAGLLRGTPGRGRKPVAGELSLRFAPDARARRGGLTRPHPGRPAGAASSRRPITNIQMSRSVSARTPFSVGFQCGFLCGGRMMSRTQ
ncbi:MAG: FkbM family methyltransferase [Rubrimonas sp.]